MRITNMINKVENTCLTLLEAVLVYLKNTEYAKKT